MENYLANDYADKGVCAKKIKVLLADDAAMFRDLVKEHLIQCGIDVIGEAGDGLEAVAKTLSLNPDIVVMDLDMPKVNGIEAIKTIRSTNSTAKILVLTAVREKEFFLDLQNYADGYLTKIVDINKLVEAIKILYDGEKYFYRQGVDDVKTQMRLCKEIPLTIQEREITSLVCQGLTNNEIAQKLHLSEQTVKNHLTNIYSKMNVKNRKELCDRLA